MAAHGDIVHKFKLAEISVSHPFVTSYRSQLVKFEILAIQRYPYGMSGVTLLRQVDRYGEVMAVGGVWGGNKGSFTRIRSPVSLSITHPNRVLHRPTVGFLIGEGIQALLQLGSGSSTAETRTCITFTMVADPGDDVLSGDPMAICLGVEGPHGSRRVRWQLGGGEEVAQAPKNTLGYRLQRPNVPHVV